MRIAVIGAGAMGCLYGGMLQQVPGNHVTLIDSWEAHVETLRAAGLIIRSARGVARISVEAVLPREVTGPADLAMVFTKSHDTEQALRGAERAIGPATTVLTLQNGLGNVEKIAGHAPIDRIIIGTTTFPCGLLGPGEIRQEGDGETKIMSADGILREAVVSTADMLNRAGFNCSVHRDVLVAIWEKVAFNSALNALCAVSRLPVGGVGDTEEGRRLAMEVVEEVTSVARRKGIAADCQRVRKTVEMAFSEHRGHQPSMLQDLLAGKRTEIGALNGAVAREAEALGMSVPVTRVLAALVAVIEKGLR